MAITDVKILTDNETAPQGFIKLNENLNAGRDGKSIYLAYKKDDNQKDPLMCITGLDVIDGRDAAVPDGWTKDPTDLNAGVGGDYLYLIYKKGGNEPLVEDIQIKIVGAEKDLRLPPNYRYILCDLNKGAGGNWIFLTYRQDLYFDLNPLIPLQAAQYCKHEFVAKLSGSAIQGTDEYEIHFDTGSWTLSIPYGCLNKANLEVLAGYKVTSDGIEKAGKISDDNIKNKQKSAEIKQSAKNKLNEVRGQEFKTEADILQKITIDFDANNFTDEAQLLNFKKQIVKCCLLKDDWGKVADKVKGQIGLKSNDGKTDYYIDDYVFFARKNDDGTDAPCDRTAAYGNSIMGAFPSIAPGSNLKSLPYALAEKYSKEKKLNLGFGIVTPKDKSFLMLGDDQQIKSYATHWRTDVPNWQDANVIPFCPEATPGFTVKFTFPDKQETINGVTKPKEIVVSDAKATIDTGAPDLTLRLGKGNPQDDPSLAEYFTTTNAFFSGWGGAYATDAKMIIGNCKVTIEFKDSSDLVTSYSFDVDQSKNKVAVGTWNGAVPWAFSEPSFARNRINLGNTIYRYCPIFFYDIKNKRVGIMVKQ